jgi:hypothetical protein
MKSSSSSSGGITIGARALVWFVEPCTVWLWLVERRGIDGMKSSSSSSSGGITVRARALVLFVEPSPVWLVERRGIGGMKSSSSSSSGIAVVGCALVVRVEPSPVWLVERRGISGIKFSSALVPLGFADLRRLRREPGSTPPPKSICIAKRCGISLLINSASSGNA